MDISFTHLNSLILKSPTHKIVDIRAGDKNLELKFIILESVEQIKTKKGIIYKFLVADQSACIEMNFFDEGKIVNM